VEPPLPSRAGGQGCPRIRDQFRISRLPTPSVSWLGGIAPRSLPTSKLRQWLARKFSALQSRGGDGFAPSSRHGVCGDCDEALAPCGNSAVRSASVIWSVSRYCKGDGRLINIVISRHSSCRGVSLRFVIEERFLTALGMTTRRLSRNLSSSGHLPNKIYKVPVSFPRLERKLTRGRPCGPRSTSSGTSKTSSSHSR
jgi:hypothetical protein